MEHLYTKEVPYGIIEATDELRLSLNTDGFHVMLEFDAQEHYKKYLEIGCGNCTVFEIHHDAHSEHMISQDCAVGLLIPYRVIVYERLGHVYISTFWMSTALDEKVRSYTKLEAMRIEGLLRTLLQQV